MKREFTQEHKDNMSKVRIGKITSESTKLKLSKITKGKKFSEEHKKKISETRKNLFLNGILTAPFKGKKRPEISHEKNPNWKGDDCSKDSLHKWVARYKPKPNLCTNCNKEPPYDLANISQEYHRDINDFEWLCRKCHIRQDGRINILKDNSLKRQSERRKLKENGIRKG